MCASGVHASAEPVPVRYPARTDRATLELRTLKGTLLATGEQVQMVEGNRVQKRLTFHFLDGSLDEEATVFSQEGTLRLLAYHLVQKGPAFPHPSDMSIDVQSGRVAVRYVDKDGHAKSDEATIRLPSDVSNGMMVDLLENLRGSSLPLTLSYVAATPKPRLIQLKVRRVGGETLSTAAGVRQAIHYALAIHVGGIEGVIGASTGQIVPDSQVWISEGGFPVFLRSETVLSMSTPMWRIEPAAPKSAER